MHVVIEGVPIATPSPTDLCKGLRDHISFEHHARFCERPIEVIRGEFREHKIALLVRVVERVDVDYQPVGML